MSEDTFEKVGPRGRTWKYATVCLILVALVATPMYLVDRWIPEDLQLTTLCRVWMPPDVGIAEYRIAGVLYNPNREMGALDVRIFPDVVAGTSRVEIDGRPHCIMVPPRREAAVNFSVIYPDLPPDEEMQAPEIQVGLDIRVAAWKKMPSREMIEFFDVAPEAGGGAAAKMISHFDRTIPGVEVTGIYFDENWNAVEWGVWTTSMVLDDGYYGIEPEKPFEEDMPIWPVGKDNHRVRFYGEPVDII